MNPDSDDKHGMSNPARGINRLSSNHQWKHLRPEKMPVDYTELKYRAPENFMATQFAKGLGWFSIALGISEVVAPKAIGNLIGASDKYRKFLPLLGMREIAHGVAILRQTKPTKAVWSRVAGDGIDLAFLGTALNDKECQRPKLLCATAAVMSVAVLDVLCASMLSNQDWNDSAGNELAPTTLGQSSGRQRR